jgi:hypothetical protein
LNICENQNGEKIIANTGNFRKEPRRMTQISLRIMKNKYD